MTLQCSAGGGSGAGGQHPSASRIWCEKMWGCGKFPLPERELLHRSKKITGKLGIDADIRLVLKKPIKGGADSRTERHSDERRIWRLEFNCNYTGPQFKHYIAFRECAATLVAVEWWTFRVWHKMDPWMTRNKRLWVLSNSALPYTRVEATSFRPLFTFSRRGCVREVYCSSMCWRIKASRLVPVASLSLMEEAFNKFKNWLTIWKCDRVLNCL